MKKNKKPKNINPPLSVDQIELKLRSLEMVIYVLRSYLLTSQAQQDALVELFDNLRVLLGGVCNDALNAGHSEDCPLIDRIMDSVNTIDTAVIGSHNKKKD
ncbi:hypothetical protein [Gracilimonas sediminicola]|uniref:hypothetical protein n=1 Tax=Gracilimonas sediminicola TaxID=2952158 RepID=UPI0038D4B9F0